jgi:hypothetical protein
MGSDNAGKRARPGRLLLPAVAGVIMVLGAFTFYTGASPNQVQATYQEAVALMERERSQGMAALNQFVDNHKVRFRGSAQRQAAEGGRCVARPRLVMRMARSIPCFDMHDADHLLTTPSVILAGWKRRSDPWRAWSTSWRRSGPTCRRCTGPSRPRSSRTTRS